MQSDWTGHHNSTLRRSFEAEIDALHERLEGAKELPDYAIAMITILGFMCMCVFFQGMVLLTVMPCWMGWRRWRRIEEEHEAYQRDVETEGGEQGRGEGGVELAQVNEEPAGAQGSSSVNHNMED